MKQKTNCAIALLITWVTTLILLSHFCSSLQMFDHDFEMDDREKFEVSVMTSPTDAELYEKIMEQNKERVIPLSLNGELYQCIIPSPMVSKKGKQKVFDQKLAAEEAFKTFINWPDTCHYRFTGWWIYEVCYNKHIRQFHQEQGKGVTMEFYLGYLAKNEKLTQEEKRRKAREVYESHILPDNPEYSYISFTYSDGTSCDLTNKPRKTEIRLYCPSEAKTAQIIKNFKQQQPSIEIPTNIHYIDSVEEPLSCNYVVKIYVNSLCKVDGFTKEESETNKVKCYIDPKLLQVKKDEIMESMKDITESIDKDSSQSKKKQAMNSIRSLFPELNLHEDENKKGENEIESKRSSQDKNEEQKEEPKQQK